jgi:hypothetical protein
VLQKKATNVLIEHEQRRREHPNDNHRLGDVQKDSARDLVAHQEARETRLLLGLSDGGVQMQRLEESGK